jgi:hypothetical protein
LASAQDLGQGFASVAMPKYTLISAPIMRLFVIEKKKIGRSQLELEWHVSAE